MRSDTTSRRAGDTALAAAQAVHTASGAAAADGAVAAVKPLLRGWLHAGVSPLALAAGIVLVALAPAGTPRLVSAVYATAALLLFATSGVYHRFAWRDRPRTLLRRLDHSNVYLMIAGTYTPVAALALPEPLSSRMLWFIWVAAAVGVTFRWVWPDAPRALYTALYIVLGWALVPFVGTLLHSAGVTVLVLTLAGGALYTVGAVVYATKWPDPSPRWFGFHEVFHACTIAAWIVQYVAVSFVVYGS